MLTVEVNGRRIELPLPWLRDSCRCGECVHPSGQRTVDPAEVSAAAVRSSATEGDVLSVEWDSGHRSQYALSELVGASPVIARETWDATLTPVPTGVHDDIVGDHAAMAAWLGLVERFGFAVLTGVPIADGEVARVAERFGFVRMTNYGRFFDVRSVVDPTNLAYTGLGLAPHTDNPYRDPVPTLQLLHCIAATTSGGDNSLVDGFRVAEVLGATDVDAFAALCSTDVEFRYSDTDSELVTRQPVLGLDARWNVRSVRFNPRSIQPPPFDTPRLADWYRGYTEFARLVNDPALQVTFRLQPGELFIVDNRRVLHGRTAFDPSAGSRHLQGCYADIDGLRSTLAVLQREATA